MFRSRSRWRQILVLLPLSVVVAALVWRFVPDARLIVAIVFAMVVTGLLAPRIVTAEEERAPGSDYRRTPVRRR